MASALLFVLRKIRYCLSAGKHTQDRFRDGIALIIPLCIHQGNHTKAGVRVDHKAGSVGWGRSGVEEDLLIAPGVLEQSDAVSVKFFRSSPQGLRFINGGLVHFCVVE